MELRDVLKLDVEEFFRYVRTIDYGYRDRSGGLHRIDDPDFAVEDYAFSGPADVVKNGVGWCWDVGQLIRLYLRENGYEAQSWYFEYLDEVRDFHQTHVQVFAKIGAEWVLCPENSDPEPFGAHRGELRELVEELAEQIFSFCRHRFGEVDRKKYLVKAFDAEFDSGISDEEYMQRVRMG